MEHPPSNAHEDGQAGKRRRVDEGGIANLKDPFEAARRMIDSGGGNLDKYVQRGGWGWPWGGGANII
jgi:hypothetical protein